jgi:dTDP-4-dehydrorhamnose reductase
LKKLTILIAGDKGQLGGELFAQLSLQNFELLRGSDYGLDITCRDACLCLLDKLSPDIIINAAAYTAVDHAEANQEQAFLVNGESPKTLAQWCQQHSCYLIHISTDYVFSGTKPLYRTYCEADPVDPVSVYGQSKLQGENHIAAIMTDGYAVLRTAWLYGFYGNNFLKTMLKLTLANPEKEFKVVNDQYGSPTSTIALSHQILLLVNKRAAGEKVSGVFHATSDDYCSWYEFACEFFQLMNVKHHFLPCSTQEYPTAATRPTNSILENKHLNALNINSFVDWRKDLCRYVNQHGEQLLNDLKQ